VEVVMALEDEFAINIYDDQAAELRTVGDVVACVATSLRRRPQVSAP
jgi:acyl carrier protein